MPIHHPAPQRYWPPGRPNARNARVIAVLILVAGVGIGLATYVSFSNSADDQDGRWMGIVFVVLAPSIAASSWLMRVRRLDAGLDDVVVVPPEEIAVATRKRADAGRVPEANGLGFRYGLALAWMYGAPQIVGVVFFAVLAVLGWRAWTGTGDWTVLAFVAFAALVVLPPPVETLRGTLRRGVVILTSEQVIHRSWMFDSWCSWDDVLAVEPVRLFADRDLRVRAGPSAPTPSPARPCTGSTPSWSRPRTWRTSCGSPST